MHIYTSTIYMQTDKSKPRARILRHAARRNFAGAQIGGRPYMQCGRGKAGKHQMRQHRETRRLLGAHVACVQKWIGPARGREQRKELEGRGHRYTRARAGQGCGIEREKNMEREGKGDEVGTFVFPQRPLGGGSRKEGKLTAV
jgi:hypothetical protein